MAVMFLGLSSMKFKIVMIDTPTSSPRRARACSIYVK
jgi:hypothetical protein